MRDVTATEQVRKKEAKTPEKVRTGQLGPVTEVAEPYRCEDDAFHSMSFYVLSGFTLESTAGSG